MWRARACSSPLNWSTMQSVAESLERLGDLANTAIVTRLATAFADAGYELALVGGPVRDALLGRPVNDLDFTTNARPDDILRVVAPLADAHWDIGREFGTIGARIAGETVEITTYRADSYDGETRKPDVVFGDTLEGDLVRQGLHRQRARSAGAGDGSRRPLERRRRPDRRHPAHAEHSRDLLR